MSGLDIAIDRPTAGSRAPAPSAVLELLKPVTWFAPVWAFMCGVVSSGVSLATHWPLALAGMVLAGPAICAASQAANDWFDRHVDAINEPARPIPSGRIPGRWGLWIAMFWSGLSLTLAITLGRWVTGAAVLGLVLAWVYSAPPLRLKQAGWWGPTSVALCYEGLSWFTGAAVMKRRLSQRPRHRRSPRFTASAPSGSWFSTISRQSRAIASMGVLSVPVDLGRRERRLAGLRA